VAPKKGIQASVGHVGIEVSSVKNARSFYEVLAEALGLRRVYESKETIGWGNKEFQIWIAVSETPPGKKGATHRRGDGGLRTPSHLRYGQEISRCGR